MAQIGSFTRGDDGSFTGTIKVFNTKVPAIIRPTAQGNNAMQDYQVTANGVELGAGWTKWAEDTGPEYLALKLDDHAFVGPFDATLVPGEDGEHKLFKHTWSR